MVLERALITVTPGREEEFEQAFRTARAQLEGSPGFVSGTLSRGVESPSTYLLLVEWQTLEDHTEGFRGSPAFTEWRRLLGPLFADAPAVEHYTQVSTAGPGAR